MYIFTVTVSKAGRSSVASVFITVLETSPPSVSITPLGLTKVKALTSYKTQNTTL